MFIDSHAHLSMLINERDVSKNQIIKELLANQVETVLNISGESGEIDHALKIEQDFTDKNIRFFHAAGVHPHEAQNASDDYTWIRENSQKIVAVGEVGLDFHYDFSPRKDQEKVFRNMIELSIELQKPLIVHGRSAEDKAFQIIKEHGNKMGKVLFHCYTGDFKTAQKIVNEGWFISFSGILTFKKSTSFHEILRTIGIDKVLFETDSPFLAPVPFRGKVNTPAKVMHVYEFAADLLGIGLNEVIANVENNFKNLFGV